MTLAPTPTLPILETLEAGAELAPGRVPCGGGARGGNALLGGRLGERAGIELLDEALGRGLNEHGSVLVVDCRFCHRTRGQRREAM